jgi:hypothetical protein
VKKIQNDIDTLKTSISETGSEKKKKILKRKRNPTSIAEANSEEY